MRTVQDYLRLAYSAASRSLDPSNQNGAVLVASDGQFEVACNTFPRGVDYTKELLKDRDWKRFRIEHAERAAIYGASFQGVATNGATLYCPWFACGDCARAIVMSGIYKVVGHKERMDTTPERWKASVEAGLKIIRDGNVLIEFYEGQLACAPIIVNGEAWEP